MKQEAFKYFTDTYIPAIGLFIFFFIFLMVLVWIFRSGSKQIYQYIEQIPLDEAKGGEKL